GSGPPGKWASTHFCRTAHISAGLSGGLRGYMRLATTAAPSEYSQVVARAVGGWGYMSARGPRFAALAVLAAAACVGMAATAANRTVTYRWVDDQGVVHYGDHVPPQYAQKEHTEINAQGVELKRLDAEKTPEEAAADSRKQEEILRQKQRDSFLLTTYTSVHDIEALRDERVLQLKAQRAASEAYVETLRARLAALQSRAFVF